MLSADSKRIGDGRPASGKATARQGLKAGGWKKDAGCLGPTAEGQKLTGENRSGTEAESARDGVRTARFLEAKTGTGRGIKGDTRVFYDKSAEVEENKRFARLLMSVE
jgi:hypothetical protein